jgi:ADP-heptose:LPS heptosyltransferase
LSPITNTHLLVLRFSAMGDVAMTVPVVKSLLQQHPGVTITFVSEKKFGAVFAGIQRLNFLPADLKGKHHGIAGLRRLYKEITQGKKFDGIVDLHNVLRTKLLTGFFRFAGYQVYKIDKGRTEKRKLTRRNNKKLVPLKSTFQRYADVFDAAGYPVLLNEVNIISFDAKSTSPGDIKIGVAPFAKHKEKMYPVDKMEKVIEWLCKKHYKVFLFGGGKEEEIKLGEWEKKYNGVINCAEKFSFAEELELIRNLDLMISMDSANMHLASLFAVPVISIWGPTHSFLGFYGYGQDRENIIQSGIECRPCSVFGNKKCFRGDHACMQMISPEQVISKLRKMLG